MKSSIETAIAGCCNGAAAPRDSRLMVWAGTAALALAASSGALAQQITPEFSGAYTLTALGEVPGVPANLGGLGFDPAAPNVLLLGGAANGSEGAIYSVPLLRDALGHINGFGTASLRTTAPYIDGGLFVAPGGVVVYAGYPINTIGQILPGSVVPDSITSMTELGVPSSLGSVVRVPEGFPGAGRWKTATYNGGAWRELIVSGPSASGLVTFTGSIDVPGSDLSGPEGITFAPRCSPLIPRASTIITEYSAGRVAVFELNSSGDPIWATRRVLVTDLGGAEGAAIDPVTGDFLFSTYGSGNQVVRVTGFAAFRCLADVVGPGGGSCDQTVDGSDFIAFINSFSLGNVASDPVADVNEDGLIDGSDFILFINAFGAGC